MKCKSLYTMKCKSLLTIEWKEVTSERSSACKQCIMGGRPGQAYRVRSTVLALGRSCTPGAFLPGDTTGSVFPPLQPLPPSDHPPVLLIPLPQLHSLPLQSETLVHSRPSLHPPLRSPC